MRGLRGQWHFRGRADRSSTLIEAVDEALDEIGTTRWRKKNVVVESFIDDVNQHADEIEVDRILAAAAATDRPTEERRLTVAAPSNSTLPAD